MDGASKAGGPSAVSVPCVSLLSLWMSRPSSVCQLLSQAVSALPSWAALRSGAVASAGSWSPCLSAAPGAGRPSGRGLCSSGPRGRCGCQMGLLKAWP